MGRKNLGNETLGFVDAATSPTIAGQIQLNGEDLEQHSAGAARVLCKEEMAHSLIPKTDDTYYLGENSSPFKAFKGIVLKDTTDGKHYRIQVTNGAIEAIALD